LPTYTVVATHGAAHNQQFEVECTVPKLDVKVSGSGASRRAAEQAAAKKALDEVMAAAPAVVAKPKRSKGARAAKNAEPEIVPGVTGVQAALDLRSPDRKNERGAGRGESRAAAAAEPAAERPALTAAAAPLAVIRAAHVEYSGQDKTERAEKAEKTEKTATHAGDKSADKAAAEKAAEKLDTKAADAKPAEAKSAEAKPEAKPEAAAVRSVDKHRSREATAGPAVPVPSAAAAPTEHDPGVADAVQTRVADAGH
jgi:ribonuclease-3